MANWLPNGNEFRNDYSPQTQINASSAQYLSLAWLFPLPPHPAALLTTSGGLAVDTNMLIVNGTAYALGQDAQVFALNMATGNQLWTYITPLLPNSTGGVTGTGGLNLHIHDGETAFTTKNIGPLIKGPTYWVSTPNHTIWAINAKTGAPEENFTMYGTCLASTLGNAQPTQVGAGVNAAGDLAYEGWTPATATAYCGVTEIAGNNPLVLAGGVENLAANIVLDQNKGELITGLLSASAANGGRGYYQAWNMNVAPPR